MPLFGPPNVEKLKARGNIRGLIKALDYEKDAFVRRDAVVALGELKAVAAVDKLIEAVQDATSSVRDAAIVALGEIGDRRAVMPMVHLLDNPDVDLRRTTTTSLAKIGRPAVRPLIDILCDAEMPEAIHQVAADILLEIGRPAIKRLATIMMDREMDPAIRILATDTLGKIGDRRVVKVLIATLKDRDVEVRRAAAFAIDAFGMPADPTTQAWYAVAKEDWLRAQYLAQAALPPLMSILTDEEADSRVRGMAAETLGKIGLRAVDPLVETLQSGRTFAKVAAIHALRRIGDPRSIQPVVNALFDKDPRVRESAAGALPEFGDRRVVSPLIDAFGKLDPPGQVAVARALARIGDERAVEHLIPALKSRDAGLRRSSAEALRRLNDERAIGPLIPLLMDPQLDVRKAASNALTRITGELFGDDASGWRQWWEEQQALKRG